tara:strand:+ start:1701 stop:4559 length:2859 start_codon:yes stop_codon:yes gene_type:complete
VDPQTGYLSGDGAFSIYLSELKDGQPYGRRHFLFNCAEGALMTGEPVGIGGKDYILVAAPLDECECDEIDLNNWECGDQGILAIKFFIDPMCHDMVEQAPKAFVERTESDQAFAIGAGNRFRAPGAGLFLLLLSEGELALCGHDKSILVANDSPLVHTGDLWFSTRTDTKGNFSVASPREPVAILRQATRNMVRLFITAGKTRVDEFETQEANRLKRLSKLEGSIHQDSIKNLLFAPNRKFHIPQRETPLLTCLDAISEASGIQMETDPGPKPTLPAHEQIEQICRISNCRVRRARLQDEWWNYDCGSMLAFKGKDKLPIALISVGADCGLSRRYEVVDPERGQRLPFDPKLNAELDEDVYVFTNPLPQTDGPISFFQLSKFTFQPFLKDIRLVILLSLAASMLGGVVPLANRMMVDHVIPDANRRLLFDLGIGMAIMSISLFLFNMAQGLISLRMKTGLTAHLQSAIIDRLLRLPARFFKKFTSGDLLNRAMMISEISAGFSMTVLSSLLSLFSTVVMLGLCFYYSAKLAFLALIAATLTAIFGTTFSYLIRTKALELEIRSGKLFGTVTQMVQGVSKLQTAGAESRAFNEWTKLYGYDLKLQYRIAHLSHWSGMIGTFIQLTSTIGLYYFSGVMAQKTEELRMMSPLIPPLITIGTFFALQGAFSAVIGGVNSFFGTFLTLHQQLEKRKLVRPILEEPIECGAGRINPGTLSGNIEVKGMNFRYGTNLPLVLNDIDFQAKAGEFIAIVGPSGGGKTTLLKLLLGFEVPESGQILFDKKDAADLDMTAARKQIGVVLQDGKVNAGTVFDNIAGACQTQLDEAWEAAESAGFAEDIRSLPMGMHTLVTEGGTTLSGGQRQRLLIARALAPKPRIVFFDEATSALDNRTQETVTNSLNERRITRIIVAHRLSTIMDADRIYVMDKGCVAQNGSYEQLIAEEGPFRELARRQAS